MTTPHRPLATTTATERDVLASFLDMHREVVVAKVTGLAAADAARRLVPSQTTLAGLLKHLAVTEREWFWQTIGGEAPLPGEDEGDPDTTWELSPDNTPARLAAQYATTFARSREILSGKDLDDVVTHRVLGPVSVRWVVVHMIEETARHTGHADILRELTDGATGVV